MIFCLSTGRENKMHVTSHDANMGIYACRGMFICCCTFVVFYIHMHTYIYIYCQYVYYIYMYTYMCPPTGQLGPWDTWLGAVGRLGPKHVCGRLGAHGRVQNSAESEIGQGGQSS